MTLKAHYCKSYFSHSNSNLLSHLPIGILRIAKLSREHQAVKDCSGQAREIFEIGLFKILINDYLDNLVCNDNTLFRKILKIH